MCVITLWKKEVDSSDVLTCWFIRIVLKSYFWEHSFMHILRRVCVYYLRPQQGSVSSLIRASSTLRGSKVNTYRNTSRHRKNPKIISYKEREREISDSPRCDITYLKTKSVKLQNDKNAPKSFIKVVDKTCALYSRSCCSHLIALCKEQTEI